MYSWVMVHDRRIVSLRKGRSVLTALCYGSPCWMPLGFVLGVSAEVMHHYLFMSEFSSNEKCLILMWQFIIDGFIDLDGCQC